MVGVGETVPTAPEDVGDDGVGERPAGDDMPEPNMVYGGAQRQVVEEEKASEQAKEDFGAIDKQIMEILGGLVELESEEAKQIVAECIGDKEKFVGMFKEVLVKKKERDDIVLAEKLEEKFNEIDDKMKALFVVGRYENHYKGYERYLIDLCSQWSNSLGEKAVQFANDRVSVREAHKIMADLETKVKVYEGMLKETKKKENLYSRQIDGLTTGVLNSDFALKVIALGIEKTEGKIKEMVEQESTYIASGNRAMAEKVAENRDRVIKDLEKMYDKRNSLSSEINTNSPVLTRKETAHAKLKFSSVEYQLTFDAARSHLEIIRNMLDDYKNGTPMKIKDGRLLIQQIRARDDKMGEIDKDTFDALQEAYKTPRNIIGLNSPYIGNEMQDLRASSRKASEESYRLARQNAERVRNNSCHRV